VAQAVGPTLCLLGDQGFTNGVGALAAAGDLNVPLALIVCNNGSAVSLRTQSEADQLSLHRLDRSLLGNSTRMSYTEVARGYGIDAQRLLWPDDDAGERAVESAATRSVAVLSQALRLAKPFLLELVVPGSIGFWKGIWRVDGNEGRAPGCPTQTD
jgi:acetolactate synthase-1/2/3 large subunit